MMVFVYSRILHQYSRAGASAVLTECPSCAEEDHVSIPRKTTERDVRPVVRRQPPSQEMRLFKR